jgi:hypothetical protein
MSVRPLKEMFRSSPTRVRFARPSRFVRAVLLPTARLPSILVTLARPSRLVRAAFPRDVQIIPNAGAAN